MFEQELMAGKYVHLTEIDPDVDAALEAAWTQNPRYRLLMQYDKPRGWTAEELKKHYETHLRTRMSTAGNSILASRPMWITAWWACLPSRMLNGQSDAAIPDRFRRHR